MRTLAIVALLIACDPAENPSPRKAPVTDNRAVDALTVTHDDARGVTCYIGRWYAGGPGGYGFGLSCVPDSALRDGGSR